MHRRHIRLHPGKSRTEIAAGLAEAASLLPIAAELLGQHSPKADVRRRR
ncbi:hypothetical protein NE852_28100 (plasmid) [Rhizobium sp. Pop5]|nr:hypothetical protein [Rhizobium sp. Pop5]UVD60461.1 hypothetical protein NE852_28100 [Rhizobium sp. Pop5]